MAAVAKEEELQRLGSVNTGCQEEKTSGSQSNNLNHLQPLLRIVLTKTDFKSFPYAKRCRPLLQIGNIKLSLHKKNVRHVGNVARAIGQELQKNQVLGAHQPGANSI